MKRETNKPIDEAAVSLFTARKSPRRSRLGPRRHRRWRSPPPFFLLMRRLRLRCPSGAPALRNARCGPSRTLVTAPEKSALVDVGLDHVFYFAARRSADRPPTSSRLAVRPGGRGKREGGGGRTRETRNSFDFSHEMFTSAPFSGCRRGNFR